MHNSHPLINEDGYHSVIDKLSDNLQLATTHHLTIYTFQYTEISTRG